MAARAQEPFDLELLDLRHFQARDLVPLLEEEGRLWLSRLRWDFQSSSEIVRRYVDLRSLSGYVLLDGRLPVGYCYYIQEDHKVLIGDLFVSQAYRSLDNQHRLLMQVVDTARHTPGVRRIEAQLMMLESDAIPRLYPPSQLSVFERNFMLVDGIAWLSRERFGPATPSGLLLDRWNEQYAESVAALIARSYQFHVDSRINDQYRSLAGARRFLHNIVQYPGCGAFHQPAAQVALDAATRQVCGVCLTSLVAPRVGHITQVCVAPERRGEGIGSELLWRSVEAFREHNCTALSLTVTDSNTGAVRLYERIGFQTLRRFRAYVWEGF